MANQTIKIGMHNSDPSFSRRFDRYKVYTSEHATIRLFGKIKDSNFGTDTDLADWVVTYAEVVVAICRDREMAEIIFDHYCLHAIKTYPNGDFVYINFER